MRREARDMALLAPGKPGIIFAGMRRTPRLPLFAFLAAAACGAARAETLEYAIAIKDGMPATLEAPFAVPYAGIVALEAQWTGPRLLFFGVDVPGRPGYTHRSGPSPQRIEFSVSDPVLVGHAGFRITVKALASRGAATGHLKITVPDAPEIVAARE